MNSLNHLTLASLKSKLTDLVIICIKRPTPRVMLIIFITFFTLMIIGYGVIKYIDPNAHKEEIEKMIFERTGQAIALQGPLQISIWPFPALEAMEVALKNKNIALTAKNLKIYPNIRSLFSDKKYIELALSDIHFDSYQIPELYTYITFEKGIIDLKATKCELVKGKNRGTIEIDTLQIDTNGSLPKYYLKHHGQNFPLSFFITLTGGDKTLLTGDNTRLNIELTAEGNELAFIKKSLAGQIEVEISKGKFQGTDLITTLRKAKSFIGTMATKLTRPLVALLETLIRRESQVTGTTPFDVLKMSAKLKNGILDNHDLKIHHPDYQIQGKGHVNLHKNTVDYRVEAIYKGDPTGHSIGAHHASLHSAPLIIFISGPFKKPDIKTDFDSYLKFVSNAESKAKNQKSKKKPVPFFKKLVQSRNMG